jgi:hypothetical protein
MTPSSARSKGQAGLSPRFQSTTSQLPQCLDPCRRLGEARPHQQQAASGPARHSARVPWRPPTLWPARPHRRRLSAKARASTYAATAYKLSRICVHSGQGRRGSTHPHVLSTRTPSARLTASGRRPHTTPEHCLHLQHLNSCRRLNDEEITRPQLAASGPAQRRVHAS